MCWNEAVSLNTFLFSVFVLGLVYYNNTYTKYKIEEFNNKWLYILFMSAILMQLIEFFIWRNIKNKTYNKNFTMLAFILVFIQPIASLMILSNYKIRNIMLSIYIIIGIPYLLFVIFTKKFYSTVSSLGHLEWNIKINKIFFWIWLFFLLFSLFYEKKWLYLIFGIVTLSIFIYKEYQTSGSLWCWFVNSISIYLAVYLLFYLPFYETKEIC